MPYREDGPCQIRAAMSPAHGSFIVGDNALLMSSSTEISGTIASFDVATDLHGNFAENGLAGLVGWGGQSCQRTSLKRPIWESGSPGVRCLVWDPVSVTRRRYLSSDCRVGGCDTDKPTAPPSHYYLLNPPAGISLVCKAVLAADSWQVEHI